jgi:TPR repeat protein
MVAKNETSAYVAGKTSRWLKVKVPGWTDSEDRWKRGKLYWEGRGLAKDQDKARKLLEAAAARGDIDAMAGLADIAQGEEARRWRAALEQAEQLKRSISFVDPTERANRGEPRIAPNAIRVAPSAPTNLQIR